MTERDDHDDEQSVLFDGVDNAVVADADAESIATTECFRTRRSGISCHERDCTSNARLILPIYAPKPRSVEPLV